MNCCPTVTVCFVCFAVFCADDAITRVSRVTTRAMRGSAPLRSSKRRLQTTTSEAGEAHKVGHPSATCGSPAFSLIWSCPTPTTNCGRFFVFGARAKLVAVATLRNGRRVDPRPTSIFFGPLLVTLKPCFKIRDTGRSIENFPHERLTHLSLVSPTAWWLPL